MNKSLVSPRQTATTTTTTTFSAAPATPNDASQFVEGSDEERAMFVAENYGNVIDQIIAEHYPENVLSKAPKAIMQTSTTSSTKAISPTMSTKMTAMKGVGDNGSIGREVGKRIAAIEAPPVHRRQLLSK